MWLNNKGQTETEILQNRFTAYLSRAIRRRRNEYIQRILKRQQTESLTECLMSDIEYNMEQKLLNELPLMIRLENDALLQALEEINQRERDIFLVRVLDEKGFGEIAKKYGLSYKGAAAIYYRAVRKIKNRMGEIGNVF